LQGALILHTGEISSSRVVGAGQDGDLALAKFVRAFALVDNDAKVGGEAGGRLF